MKAILKGEFDKLLRVAEALDQFDSVGNVLKMELEKHPDGRGVLVLKPDEKVKDIKDAKIPYKLDILHKQVELELS